MEGGGTGDEDIDSLRGASFPRCLAMAEGGGFDVEGGREVDAGGCGRVCAELKPSSAPDRVLYLSQALSLSSFSGSSDFFQRGPNARLNLLGPVL